MPINIPVKNIYIMFLYAWRKHLEGTIVNIDAEEHTDLQNLSAKILNNGLNHLFKRGLTRDYRSKSDEIKSVKGKIIFNTTIKKNLLMNGKVSCEFDEFDEDNIQNQIIKATISKLIKTNNLDQENKNNLIRKKIRFSGWQGDKVIRLFKRDQCRYEEKHVHAEIICNGNVGVLKNRLAHFTFKDISHYLEKWDRYSTWSAQDHYKKGQKPNLFHFVFKPAFRFFRDFILRLGFLDGVTGLIVCSLSSMGIFMRYVKLKQILQAKN